MKTDMHHNATGQIFENARLLRKKSTVSENVMWNALRNRKILGVKFRRQHPVESFIADFYSRELNLIIEIDGKIHNKKEQKDYDEARSFEMAKYEIKVIRFSNEEVINNLDKVITKLKKHITLLKQKSLSLQERDLG